MKRRQIIVGLVAVLGAVLIIYFQFFYNSSSNFQWYESYDADSDQPYGTLFMRKLMKSSTPRNFVYNEKRSAHELLDSAKYNANANYVLIGSSCFFDNLDVIALKKFIERGNNVFIATQAPPDELISAIYNSYCADITYDYASIEEVGMNFYHNDLKSPNDYFFKYRFYNMDRSYTWDYLAPEVLCDSAVAITPLGYQKGDVVNFFKIPYGRGNLYLHTNPIVFTNYFLLNKDKVDYAGAVFSHLTGDKIIWDEFSKLPYSMMDRNGYNSPLYFILQQPSLKYAWWMILFTVLAFVIFAAKRTQRVIPVIEPKSNTSLEFITMISALHYENGNHIDIARKKMKYFLYFIRTRFGIHAHSFSKEHVKLLAERSKVNEGIIQYIYERWIVIENFSYSSIEVHRLIDLYNAIDAFYKQCK